MEDRFTKFSKLYALIFLMFLSVPVMLALLVASFYGFSKLVSSSVVDIIFGLGMITSAPALFLSVYVIFFKRTALHPAVTVRFISRSFFVIGFVCSIFVLFTDIISFFTKFEIDSTGYRCFSLVYLTGNIAGLFLIAILQAFTTKKEVDWLKRNQLK